MPELTGPSHIDLTATDVERSARWREEVVGFSHVSSTEQAAIVLEGVGHYVVLEEPERFNAVLASTLRSRERWSPPIPRRTWSSPL